MNRSWKRIKERKANWLGHTLRRNCLIENVIEGDVKVGGRRGSQRTAVIDIKEGDNGMKGTHEAE